MNSHWFSPYIELLACTFMGLGTPPSHLFFNFYPYIFSDTNIFLATIATTFIYDEFDCVIKCNICVTKYVLGEIREQV